MQEANEYCLERLKFLSALTDAIDAWPAELCAFEWRYEFFGSWWLIVRRSRRRTRFAFDGMEGDLSAARLSPDAGDFRDPPKQLAEVSMPRDKVEALTKVIEFIRTHA
jgi:hypothetical protein